VRRAFSDRKGLLATRPGCPAEPAQWSRNLAFEIECENKLGLRVNLPLDAYLAGVRFQNESCAIRTSRETRPVLAARKNECSLLHDRPPVATHFVFGTIQCNNVVASACDGPQAPVLCPPRASAVAGIISYSLAMLVLDALGDAFLQAVSYLAC
jgi:hypothetical protein